MKKICHNRERIKLRIADNRNKRTRKRRKAAQNVGSISRPASRGYHYLTPPETMSLSENYKETVEFLDKFRSAILSPEECRPKDVYVDLTKIKHISIPVTVVLAAEFHRGTLLQNTKPKPKRINNWSPKLVSLFNELGVFKLLKLSPKASKGEQTSLSLSPLESGLETDGKQIHSLVNRFGDILQFFRPDTRVYDGLMEAVENAISHAYPPDCQPRHRYAGPRWWAASCLDFETKEIRFFVYDQGAGIPETLPRDGIWEKVWKSVGAVPERIIGTSVRDDGYILEKAFEVSRSQTGRQERGKGLEKMRSIVDVVEKSRFRIVSGCGEVRHDHGSRIKNFTHPLHRFLK